MRWVGEKSGTSLAAFVDTLLPGENGDVLELGRTLELCWCQSLPALALGGPLCRRTRQIVGWTLGDRSLQSACDLRTALAPGYRNRRTRSDYWDAYATAFPQTHPPLLRQSTRARPATSSVGLAPCGREPVAWCAAPTRSRKTPKTTSTPSTSSSPTTTSLSDNKQGPGNHHPIVFSCPRFEHKYLILI